MFLIRRHQQGYIMRTSPITDHAHRDMGNPGKQVPEEVGGLDQIMANNGNNGLVGNHGYGTEFLEFSGDLIQAAGLVDRHRYGHFGSGDHIYGSAVFFKNGKDASQEAISQQHAAAFDIDGDNAVFGRHGLDALARCGFGDQGAFGLGRHSVQ